jgi:hypothetical protein
MASSQNRKDMLAILAIGLGLLLGFLIKRIHIGLLIGLVLGLLGGGLLGRKRR